MNTNPMHHPSPAKKWNAHFWITFNFWWLARLVDGLEHHLPPFSSQKKWNAHLWIMFNFWWSAGLVDGLKPHAPPLSSQNNEMFIFGLRSTSDDQLGWSMGSNPIRHPSPAKKTKSLLLDYVQLLIIGRAGWWTQTPTATSLQHKKMKCPFLDYVQLLIISLADQWTQTLSSIPLQPKKQNPCFWIMFNFWWSAGLVDGLEPHPPPLSSHNNEMLIFGLRSTSVDRPLGQWTWTPSALPLSSQKYKMLIFGLCSTSDDQPGWSMDSNPIRHLSPAKKLKCSFLDYVQLLIISLAVQWTWTPSATPLQPQRLKWSFLDYVQLLMISQVGRWTRTPSATSLQPKVWNACSWIMFNSDDRPGWFMDLNPMCHPSPAKKWNAHFWSMFNFAVGQPGRWTWAPSATPLQPKKWNAHFWITFNFWWLPKAGWWTRTLIHNCSQARKKWNAHFWITFNFWWLAGLVDGLKSHLPPSLHPKK